MSATLIKLYRVTPKLENNMMMNKFITALLFLILTFGILQSSNAQDARVINLEEAIELALENNFQLKQAKNNLGLAEFRELSAKADFLPSLSAGANQGRSFGRQFDNTTGEFGDFTINSFGANISSNMMIFNSFANINRLRAAGYEAQSQEEQVQRVREEIIFQTATRYLQYLLNLELLDISRENLETASRQLEQVDAQVEVGSRPSVDLLNQESIVANTELQIVNRENALELSKLQLIQTLQIDPLGEYEFVVPDIDEASMIPTEYSLEDLVRAALESRSDLKSEENRISAIERNLRVTKANFYPTLSLSLSTGSSYNDRNPTSFEDQFRNQNVRRNIGLSLQIPIFNRLNVRESVRAQEVNFRNAQLSLENTRLSVVQEVSQAFNDYKARIKELESTERALIASERAFETENQRYEIGASTLIELSQANSSYVEAQSNRIQALYNYIFQERLLDYYIGQLDEHIGF